MNDIMIYCKRLLQLSGVRSRESRSTMIIYSLHSMFCVNGNFEWAIFRFFFSSPEWSFFKLITYQVTQSFWICFNIILEKKKKNVIENGRDVTLVPIHMCMDLYLSGENLWFFVPTGINYSDPKLIDTLLL